MRKQPKFDFKTLSEAKDQFQRSALSELLPANMKKLSDASFFAGAQASLTLVQEGIIKLMDHEFESEEEAMKAGKALDEKLKELFAEASAQMMLLSVGNKP